MARPSGYRWDAPAQGMSFRHPTTAWDLRWWILAAIATSVAVNGGLLFWMGKYRLPGSEEAETIVRTGVFETAERITIPQELLQPPPSGPVDLSQPVNNEPAIKELPTIDQLAEAMKDQDVLMTPVIQEMAANATLSKPAPGKPGDPVDDVSTIKSALDVDADDSLLSRPSTLKPSLLKPADDQMVIDANLLNAGAADFKDDILKSTKKGTGGNNGLDGFKNLDDLVNFKGPIVGDFKTMLRTDLLFDFGSAQLRSDARISLMKLGMIIQTNNKAQFRLVGHTDTIGDDFSNQKLSEARARAVKDWLTGSLQLDGSRIIVEGRGEREPLPDVPRNGDAVAQQLNRRVEIHKTGGG
jgi:OOP family OmpA-OmpF porin